MIIHNTDKHVARNFTEREFFTKDPKFTGEGHYFDERLIQAVQYIRDLFNEKIIITSSYRSPEYNQSVGGEDKSYHLRGMAVDWQFMHRNRELNRKIERMPEVIGQLHEIGVKGIIFYDNFIHFDTRCTPYKIRK